MSWKRMSAIMAALAVIVAFAALLVRAERNPDGPVPIAYDKAACGHCRMHVGDPRFAAQAQLEDGQVFDFDDPGCLLSWIDENSAPLHAVWLRHSQRDEWISREDAGFVPISPTPMGFGLGAVRKDEAGALGWDQARASMTEQKAKRHHD